MSQTVIFAGPSIRKDDIAQYSSFSFRAPVEEGDILRLMEAKVERIAIIDGYFGDRRSVSHKEILFALANGVAVFGASSMGALRAAELDSYGMIGVGDIYLDYRSGRRVDDGDVAVAHGPAALDYVATSVPLVDVQATCDALVERRRITRLLADKVVRAAGLQYFADRTWDSISQAAFDDRETAKTMVQTLRSGAVQSKRLDALRLLARLDAGEDEIDLSGCAYPPLTHTFRQDLRRANCAYSKT